MESHPALQFYLPTWWQRQTATRLSWFSSRYELRNVTTSSKHWDTGNWRTSARRHLTSETVCMLVNGLPFVWNHRQKNSERSCVKHLPQLPVGFPAHCHWPYSHSLQVYSSFLFATWKNTSFALIETNLVVACRIRVWEVCAVITHAQMLCFFAVSSSGYCGVIVQHPRHLVGIWSSLSVL